MGNRRLHKIECLQRLGTSESGRQKVTALPSPERLPSARLLEAGLRAGRSKPLGSVSLSFDKPLPGKPPTRLPLPPLQKAGFLALRHSLTARGFPAMIYYFLLRPLTPPIPLGRDAARSGQDRPAHLGALIPGQRRGGTPTCLPVDKQTLRHASITFCSRF